MENICEVCNGTGEFAGGVCPGCLGRCFSTIPPLAAGDVVVCRSHSLGVLLDDYSLDVKFAGGVASMKRKDMVVIGNIRDRDMRALCGAFGIR